MLREGWDGAAGDGAGLTVTLWVTFFTGLNFQSFTLEWISFSFNYSIPMISGAIIGHGDKNVFRRSEHV